MLRRLAVCALLLMLTVNLLHAQSDVYVPCPADYAGYLPTILTLGEVAEIQAGGTPNRVRRLPSLEGEYLFDIAPGSQFPLIGGPVCTDGIVWWQVAAGGRVGWTAESNTADRLYYLQSAPPEVQPAVTLENVLSASGSAAITPENVASLMAAPYAPLPARAMAASGFNNLLAILNPDGDSLLLYNAAAPTLPFAGESLDGEGVALAASATSVSLAVGIGDDVGYRARLYAYLPGDLAPVVPTLAEDIALSADAGALVSIALQPPYLATAQMISLTQGGSFTLWDSNSGESLARFDPPIAPSDLRFNAAGTLLLASNADAGTEVPYLVDTVERNRLPLFDGRGHTAFTSDNGFALGASSSAEITSFRAFTISKPGTIDLEGRLFTIETEGLASNDLMITALVANQQASLLAFAVDVQPGVTAPSGFAPYLGFIDLDAGELLPTTLPLPDAATVRDLAFSADGSALLALVDTDIGREVRTYSVGEEED
jgi:hypothetical protein